MKMDISVVTLVFGLLMFDSSQECDYYVASGRKATLPMTFALDQSDELTWMHGMKTILRQTKDKFTSEGKNIVTANGSLTWANVAQSNAGPYKAEVHDRDGKSRWASKSTRLCVIDPVPKPTVTHECNQTEVKFTCDVQPKQAEGFDFEWLQDNQVLDTEKGQTLTRPGDQVTGPITCKLTNRVSSETSEEVHQTCYSEFYQGRLSNSDRTAGNKKTAKWARINTDSMCFSSSSFPPPFPRSKENYLGLKPGLSWPPEERPLQKNHHLLPGPPGPPFPLEGLSWEEEEEMKEGGGAQITSICPSSLGVVLLLIIGVIVCCVCSKRKKRLHLEEEEERRL
uniref:uncharacterized protein si:dkey-11f4.20 n=1 Tax=Gasterosteus aculeatus aculeatus TaxID=481459 RepID=UPI001A99FF4D|nr:uncharacterized protein si:dkey-11f4.20 [Gasterosteus aculeatus aculeatus]